MSSGILLGCFEIPGYGGAATVAYKLFENLQRDGLDLSYVNIIDAADYEYFRFRFGETFGNPDQLVNVRNCNLSEPLFDPHPDLSRLIREIDPGLMIAVDYIAALLMKTAAPDRRLIFITAGLSQVFRYLDQRRRKTGFIIDEFLREVQGGLKVVHVREKEAVEAADLIVTHSLMMRDLLLEVFPYSAGKIYSKVVWFTELVAQAAKPYSGFALPYVERDIDVLFVANSWSRTEKNRPLLQDILTRCRDLTVHIVGEISHEPPGVHCHGFLADPQSVFRVMGRSKVLVCPSQFDTGPGILWEASVLGCNVVASKACGNWMLCHEDLLAETNQATDFIEKIRRALPAKLADNMRVFYKTASYQDLTGLIKLEAGC